MEIPTIDTITSADQARELAVDWQAWAGEQNQPGEEPTLFTSDLVEWHAFFTEVTEKYPELNDEFVENGII